MKRATDCWIEWTGGLRGAFQCSKSLDDEGALVLSEGRGDPRLFYGRYVTHLHRIRHLDRDLADAGSARGGSAVGPEPPSAPAAAAADSSSLTQSLLGGASLPAYKSQGASRCTRARRAYLLGRGNGSVPVIGRHAGPPLAALPLFSWEGSAEFGATRLVTSAIWSALRRSLGELRAILTTGVDQMLILALSRTLVRLRN